MYLVFYKTSDVFAAEEILVENEIATEITPTPVQDKAYCGICLKLEQDLLDRAEVLLAKLEYQLVEP